MMKRLLCFIFKLSSYLVKIFLFQYSSGMNILSNNTKRYHGIFIFIKNIYISSKLTKELSSLKYTFGWVSK
jgi:hypothetical protein